MQLIGNVIYNVPHLLLLSTFILFINAHFYKINVHKVNRTEPQEVTFQIDLLSETVNIKQLTTELSTEWIIDEKRGLQIYKATYLGEQDMFEPLSHTVCILLSIKDKDLIPLQVVRHLYQVDSSIKHLTDNHLDDTSIIMDLELNAGDSKQTQFELLPECNGAHSIYSSERDVLLISKGIQLVEKEYTNSSISIPTTDTSTYPLCKHASVKWILGCFCEVRICVDWFPCKFKYCNEVDDLGSDVSYICGLETCSKCQSFTFFVERKKTCFWNIHPS